MVETAEEYLVVVEEEEEEAGVIVLLVVEDGGADEVGVAGEATGAGAAGRDSVRIDTDFITGRICTVFVYETPGEGAACASFTCFLASKYEMPSIDLTVQTSFSNFQARQCPKKVE